MTLTARDQARAATVLASWLASGHATRLLDEDSLLLLPSGTQVRAGEATAEQWLAAAARVADLPPKA